MVITPSLLQASGSSDLETLHIQVLDKAHVDHVIRSPAKARYFNIWHTYTEDDGSEKCTRYSADVQTLVSVKPGATMRIS